MKQWIAWLMLLLAAFTSTAAHAADGAPHQAQAVKVTTLSTMLTDYGTLGEWGFAALVEVDGRRILFDTGANPDTVLKNAEALKIDLSSVEEVVISHFHDDHTGGLLTLRKALMQKNPAALSHLYVGEGIFAPRYGKDGQSGTENDFPALAKAYLDTGGRIQQLSGPAEIASGIWLTGPVPRGHDETNWNPGLTVKTGGQLVPDTLREDTSLVIATASGVVIVTGCGHAGIMNIADAAQTITGDARLHAVIGGIHLFAKPDAVLIATAGRLKGLAYLLGAHCTGIEATVRLRELLALDRRTAVIAAVGSSFTLGKGIAAGQIAGWTG
ncbi:MBL fold metallo-hydrolase [Novosphingobium sp.]|uniref:MBL fold metallo-hydrolase n=1 Tax=Novosphingobium sp. TaxID=1874826 RepID=UPI00260F51F5|nr:MBL fold metallo-hydrolase [Novosphingobium sp.]